MQQVDVKCLAKQFANFIGHYSPYFKSNRYFSLSKACLHFGVEHTNAHRDAADALAAAIQRLVEMTPAQRKAMGAAAATHARALYSKEKLQQATLEIYHTLVQKWAS